MISVIIPVYNVEKFLCECIESVLAQDFSDFEIIAVDDGSTDGSGAMLDGFACRDSRIRVFHTPNRGLSAARNEGLRHAHGQWVVFVDSDDCLLPGALAVMHSCVQGAQVAMFQWIVGEKYEPPKRQIEGKIRIVSGIDAARMVMYRSCGQEPVAWAKIYDRALFDDLKFREGILYEDVDVMYKIMAGADKVAVSNVPVYFYRQRPGSIIHTWNERRLNVLNVTDRMVQWCATNAPELLPAAHDRRFSAYFNIFMLTAKYGGYDDVNKACWPMIRKYRREVFFSSQTRLKNKIGAAASLLGRQATKLFAKLVTFG